MAAEVFVCMYVFLWNSGGVQDFAFIHSQFELLIRYPCKI